MFKLFYFLLISKGPGGSRTILYWTSPSLLKGAREAFEGMAKTLISIWICKKQVNLMMAHMISPTELVEQAKKMEAYGDNCIYVTNSAAD